MALCGLSPSHRLLGKETALAFFRKVKLWFGAKRGLPHRRLGGWFGLGDFQRLRSQMVFIISIDGVCLLLDVSLVHSEQISYSRGSFGGGALFAGGRE